MTGYTDTIRQWAVDTRRAGTLPNADGTGEVGLENDEIGSRLAVRFSLKLDLDRVSDIRFQVFGCGFTIAACAVAADLALGYTLDDVQAIDSQSLDQALNGLPEERGYCADLAVEALHAAVASARKGRGEVEQTALHTGDEHGPRLTAEDPVYATLMSSQKPSSIRDEDRHLFACLLAVSAQEACEPATALGLDEDDLTAILNIYFPGTEPSLLNQEAQSTQESAPEHNSEVLAILLSHIPKEPGRDLQSAGWLARIIATRAACPGHLWVAMGLFQRPELTAAIRRHLPSLAEANRKNMRWKRYLYKAVCDRNGGMMCKAPNCGVCSDYALCFAED